MEIILARQPIFDRDMNVVAYELLYRSNRVDAATDRALISDGDQATSSVIIDTFSMLGLEKITGGRPAFINFTEKMILGDYATLFPKESVVVEILENIEPGNDLIDRCVSLRKAGYVLALDDFIFTFRHLPLIQMADIIKMDFLSTSHDKLREIVQVFKPDGIRFLAEKVETREEFELALKWGYELFQGYFFSKPDLMRSAELAPTRMGLLRLMHESTRDDFQYAELARAVMQDLGLSMKFLRLLNFVIPAHRGSIRSIQQGIVLLGIEEFRKWLYLLAMKDFASDQPDELTRLSLLRARICELLAKPLRLNSDASFMVGLFSLSDTIMHQSMEEVLRDLVVEDTVKKALLERSGPLTRSLELTLAYAEGRWEEALHLIEGTTLTLDQVAAIYIEALNWCDVLFDSEISETLLGSSEEEVETGG